MKQVTKEQCVDGQFYWVTEPHHGNQTIAKCIDPCAHNRIEFRDTNGGDENLPFEWYQSVYGPIPTLNESVSIEPELTSLRQYKAEAESQVPYGVYSCNKHDGYCDFTAMGIRPDHGQKITLYARPVPAGSCAVPEGWKLVPMQLTRDMSDAGFAAGNGNMHKAWSEILLVAPKPDGVTHDLQAEVDRLSAIINSIKAKCEAQS